MTNKRSMGKLPNLPVAVSIAKEVGYSVEYLLLGESQPAYGNSLSVLNAISSNERLFEIAKKLLVATPNELALIESVLQNHK